MHTPLRHSPLLCALAFATACTEAAPLGPSSDARLAAAPPADGRTTRAVTVMTRNLYIGADADLVIGALATPDPDDDFPALLSAIATLEQTSFPVRAAALAEEIARTRPDVVGLQEVEDLRIDLTPLGLPTNIDLHYLPLLQAALAARGLDYGVAGQLTSIVAEPFPGVSVVEREVILVNARRVTVEPGVIERNFAYNVGEVAPGVVLSSGWVQIQATIGGAPVTIASTHLQSGDGPDFTGLRAAQAIEFVESVGAALPAILLGDFNDVPGTPMDQVITGAGFADLWAALRPSAPGFTCCALAELSNRAPTLTQRIDYLFARGFKAGGREAERLGSIMLVGDKSGDRVAGPAHRIWPSDHAGVVARLVIAPAEELAKDR